ncbi:hypothetical protein [Vagococcus silagei]|uniref:Uncharacterized protein n=1 Tax=Vagococcus silagei TaxID=2508885 RepID=A0A4S3B103_9ENTE|nr:hypothetical protein [Vagococcus silagei]THB60701.1 hypothetical protein ESZ54_08905 [Vagococcus silagei]
MRADQHKSKSSKSKLVFFLILVILIVIGFIGYQTINSGSLGKSKSKTEDTTKAKTVIKDEDLKLLSEAVDSVTSLYEKTDLEVLRPDLTNKDVEEAKKKVEAVDDSSKAKKELVDRIKAAQEFVKTKESK